MPVLRRHTLLSLYEEAVVDIQLANVLQDDDDELYDVYLFWPSTDPHVLVPEEPLQDAVTFFPTAHPRPYQRNIEPDQTTLAAPANDPDSDLVNHDAAVVMDIAGYSRLFTAGLVQTSREVTQQLGGAVRGLRRVFTWPRWLL